MFLCLSPLSLLPSKKRRGTQKTYLLFCRSSPSTLLKENTSRASENNRLRESSYAFCLLHVQKRVKKKRNRKTTNMSEQDIVLSLPISFSIIFSRFSRKIWGNGKKYLLFSVYSSPHFFLESERGEEGRREGERDIYPLLSLILVSLSVKQRWEIENRRSFSPRLSVRLRKSFLKTEMMEEYERNKNIWYVLF